MDKLLRPKVFEIEPSAPNAQKLYKHWKVTFENYLEASIPAVTPSDNPIADQATAAANDKKRKHALINNISADVYDLVCDCEDYTAAITALDAAYVKPNSVVYSRHKLITCKQEANQSIDLFKQELQRLAKDCSFKAVSAEENKTQYMRDAFINGISSQHIRQRLLENMGELSLDEAFTQARALEQAQTHSVAYDSNTIAAVEPSDDSTDPLAAAPSQNNNNSKSHKKQNKKEQCYFCGNSRHPRTSCPARNDTCQNCKKKGHWARVCRSEPAQEQITPVSAIGGTLGVVGGFDPPPALA